MAKQLEFDFQPQVTCAHPTCKFVVPARLAFKKKYCREACYKDHKLYDFVQTGKVEEPKVEVKKPIVKRKPTRKWGSQWNG